MKIVAVNKSASFEYFIEEKYEAGIVLEGNEIKSIRLGNVNMNDSFCFLVNGEACVKNMHIALYDKSDAFSTKNTRRDRKLLLHKSELDKIGRLAYTPIADGVSPAAGRDLKGPTAAANSVSRLDHYIASNGTLFNMKFHPSALQGRGGLESFVALVRGYFDQKGSHMQFNVVSRETLRDAQKNPEKYKSLVVRVAGYSALFTTLSKGLQEDIINRTEQQGF